MFWSFFAQSVEPLTIFLSPIIGGFPYSDPFLNLLLGDAIIGLTIYLTIPIIAGSVTGLLDGDKSWVNGFLIGFISGLVNLAISLSALAQLKNLLGVGAITSVFLRAQAQFILFAFMLTLLWSLLAAFSAKATAWSFTHQIRQPLIIGPDKPTPSTSENSDT